MKKGQQQSPQQPSVRLNLTLRGLPAEWLLDWKRRGIVRSNVDAVIQSFRAFQETVAELDLKAARVRALERQGEFEE